MLRPPRGGEVWEIRRAVGRKVADTIVVESHFQLDGFATMARGARAIIDVDGNLLSGLHRPKLRNIFMARGIGPIG